jgi:hypothetical protein
VVVDLDERLAAGLRRLAAEDLVQDPPGDVVRRPGLGDDDRHDPEEALCLGARRDAGQQRTAAQLDRPCGD